MGPQQSALMVCATNKLQIAIFWNQSLREEKIGAFGTANTFGTPESTELGTQFMVAIAVCRRTKQMISLIDDNTEKSSRQIFELTKGQNDAPDAS